jgi:hypothetical protein
VGLEDCAGANLPPDVADCKLDNGLPFTRGDKRYNRTVRKMTLQYESNSTRNQTDNSRSQVHYADQQTAHGSLACSVLQVRFLSVAP